MRDTSGVIKILLSSANINSDSRDSHGQTPLLYAAEKGDLAAVQQFLARTDVNVNSKDEIDRTLLSYAAESQ